GDARHAEHAAARGRARGDVGRAREPGGPAGRRPHAAGVMSGGLARWWRERSAREQVLLAVMGALLALVLAWLLIARPLAALIASAEAREAAAAEALGAARARADRAALAGGAAVASAPLPIDSLIARTATDAGFSTARV